ncbi:Structural maintenance of chromosomes flexible hinge domain-containing protein GMI1 [Citrus sinensis]|uniref:Structural maintenance of chromosomes flexible hinge domain-containing protein GMI1 n=1 Tax=Citrus sinensis TaxID=2711 RepID=A0ACB8M2W0_CITSI|nr:Structural maintenance of chromosomes flexible hinge domain-containing protein GMI1 [Citrus sinensis]
MAVTDFICLVKDEYFKSWMRHDSMKRKRKINWNGGNLYVEDANLNKISDTIDFVMFEPSKCHILKLYDGSGEIAETFENMWDLTPDTDLLRELPEDYTFETALADLIDNSLQAVWTNAKNERRLISVNIAEDKISVFDTGPGMDGTDENSIVKWRALVSSKTKVSKEVYTLHLEKEALMRCSDAELTWRTNGGIRFPSKDEIADSPHGSFTKCDEISSTGKTTRPIEFQVNGIDLAEVAGGEVAITNMHSCNGPDFILQLHFSLRQASATTNSPGSRPSKEANARLKFVYFPVTEEGESIDIIMNKLISEGCVAAANYDTRSRVSIRRLGRLLPDVHWAWLPLMDLRQRKGEKAHLLKKFCLRVKCFIDTDAGFNPTPSKLSAFFSEIILNSADVTVEIRRDGKLLTPIQLEKDYQEWLLNMHDHYDAEKDCGVDQPILLVGHKNIKPLGISTDVARVHKVVKKKGAMWKSGQKVKLLKGAYAGIHNNDVYATIENFVIEGLQGDAGGEARIICRPLAVPDEKGCVLAVNNGNASFHIGSSLSLPIGVIDSEKCVPVNKNVWDQQLEKYRQKSPSTIELLKETQCQELEIDGVLPSSAIAGQNPPREIVAVVRPASFISSSASKNLVQKYIVKNSSEMLMEVKFKCEDENLEDVVPLYTARVAPSSRKGYQGLYIFEVGCKFPKLFQNAGAYTFSFHLTETSCKSCEKKVLVKGSSEVGKWKLLDTKERPELRVRVGSFLPPLSVVCYDIYDNRIPFESKPQFLVKIKPSKIIKVEDKLKWNLSPDKLTLNIQDILVASSKLDEIRPDYRATLVISSKDKPVSVSIPCRVTPGSLKNVAVHPQNLGILLPGSVIKMLKLEFMVFILVQMFDAFYNNVKKGLEVELNVDGFCIEDQLGLRRKVDGYGCIDLSGLLKVKAGYGKNVSLSVLSDNGVIFKQDFQTEKRELRVISGVPECCTVGSQLEDITFEIVDSKGAVDVTIHDDDKSGQSHTLTIKSDVPIVRAPKLESDDIRTPCSDGKVFLLEGPSPIKHVGNHMVPIMKIVNELESEVRNYGLCIGRHEKALKLLNDQKIEVEEVLSKLQGRQLRIVAFLWVLHCRLRYVIFCTAARVGVIATLMESGCLMWNIAGNNLDAMISKEFLCSKPRSNFMEDVVGPVALIGTVCTNKLSRTLAEYLGEHQMLALVCRSFEAAFALEKYEQDGTIDRKCALHATAAALGKSIDGRYLVICLEGIRPYSGKFGSNDPQRKLALPAPTLPKGNIPAGFVGYAVNMVNLDGHHMHIRTSAGNGLRETLLYRLFGKLQVYKTRKDMIEAHTCIRHGAVSLDGGILKEDGIISLGCGNPTICFPIVRTRISTQSIEALKQIEEKKLELDGIMQLIQESNKALEKDLEKLKNSEDKFNSFMDLWQTSLK